MKLLLLESLECVRHSGGAGNDDLFFEIKVDDAPGARKIPGDPDLTRSWDIDEGGTVSFQPASTLQNDQTMPGSALAIPFQEKVKIAVYDWDRTSDDLLGDAELDNNDSSGERDLKNADENSHYIVRYSIKDI